MLKIIICVGIQASGKSTWAKAEIAKDPINWVRINNDQLRDMLNNSVYSSENELFIANTRKYLIKQAILKDKNIILDNMNLKKDNYKEVCDIASKLNKDIQISEKLFYIDLQDALDRDALRTGTAHIGKEVIENAWRRSGKEQFKHYKCKTNTYYKNVIINQQWKSLVQDSNLQKAVVFDNDGTIALIGNRSPYDASNCDVVDHPHEHVVECLRLYYQAGYKILFVSGRQEKDRAPTERFYKKHFPEIKYELFMRPTGDMRKDVTIKEEIYNNHIAGKYFISGWYDDRLQIVKWLFQKGFPVFRVGDPEANF